MRSARGSITKLGDRHFRIRISVGFDPETGKQVRASKTIRGSRTDAEKMLDRLERQYGTADAVIYGRMSVYDFTANEFLAGRELAETTRRGYDATLRNHIKPLLSALSMKDANSHVLGKVLAHIEAPGARLNAYKMLRSVFRHAAAAGIITTNPMAAVAEPVVPAYEADVYDLDEVLDAFDAVRGMDIEPGILIAFSCGTRASETCALDWPDLYLDRVDLADGTVEHRGAVPVDDSYHRLPGKRLTKETKTKRSRRTVAIPGFVVERLLELRGDGRLGPLMTDRTGQRMTPDGFSHRWRRLTTERRDKAGCVIYTPPVRHIELKNGRHSQSTILLDEGATMHAIAVRNGHSRDSTSDDRYTKRRRQADFSTAELMDKAVRRVLTRPNSEGPRVARRGKA